MTTTLQYSLAVINEGGDESHCDVAAELATDCPQSTQMIETMSVLYGRRSRASTARRLKVANDVHWVDDRRTQADAAVV